MAFNQKEERNTESHFIDTKMPKSLGPGYYDRQLPRFPLLQMRTRNQKELPFNSTETRLVPQGDDTGISRSQINITEDCYNNKQKKGIIFSKVSSNQSSFTPAPGDYYIENSVFESKVLATIEQGDKKYILQHKNGVSRKKQQDYSLDKEKRFTYIPKTVEFPSGTFKRVPSKKANREHHGKKLQQNLKRMNEYRKWLNKSIQAPSLYDYSLQASSIEEVLLQESIYQNVVDEGKGQNASFKKLNGSVDFNFQIGTTLNQKESSANLNKMNENYIGPGYYQPNYEPLRKSKPAAHSWAQSKVQRSDWLEPKKDLREQFLENEPHQSDKEVDTSSIQDSQFKKANRRNATSLKPLYSSLDFEERKAYMKDKFGIQPSPKSLLDLNNFKVYSIERKPSKPYQNIKVVEQRPMMHKADLSHFDRFKDSALLKSNLPSHLGPGVYDNQNQSQLFNSNNDRRGRFFRQGLSKSIFEEFAESGGKAYFQQRSTDKRLSAINLERKRNLSKEMSLSQPQSRSKVKLGNITIMQN